MPTIRGGGCRRTTCRVYAPRTRSSSTGDARACACAHVRYMWLHLLDDALVTEGLHRVEDDNDARACARDSDHLLATSFAIVRALDDTWQVEQLDLGAAPEFDARDARERSELVRRRL